jgi:hypothetical protein
MANITVYLDTDCNGNDLLDDVGNSIEAGWYVYNWPNSWEPIAGPYGKQHDAIKAGWEGV